MYQVQMGEQFQEFATRTEAIDAAKAYSAENHGNVVIQDDSGRESLTYRGGTLDFYVYETRPRRRTAS